MAQPIIQPSFAAGELSPSLYARVDLSKYHSGAALMRNFFVDYRGGASTRPGTKFVVRTRSGVSAPYNLWVPQNSVSGQPDTADETSILTLQAATNSATSNAVRLIPFQFNQQQAYILEFGNQYMRVIQNGGVLLEPPLAIAAITQANPMALTVPTNAYANGDWIYVQGVNGMSQVNGNFYVVQNASGANFTVTDLDGNPINSTLYNAYISGGTASRVYTIATPYLAADLALLKFTQSADVMTLTHPSYAPMNLTRSGFGFALTGITFAASVQPPTGLGALGPTGSPVPTTSALNYRYVVTSVNDLTGEESNPSAPLVVPNFALNQITGCNNILVWVAPTTGPVPTRYNIYRTTQVVQPTDPGFFYGYVGTSVSVQFTDANIEPDFSTTPPAHENPFANSPITAVQVVTPGVTYTAGDTISVSDPTGTGWTGILGVFAVPPATTGPVSSVITVTQGQGYTAPVFSVATATGSGATFKATIGPATGNYPGVTTYFQQRQVFAASLNLPQTFWMTQTGNFANMDVSLPVQDSDAITGTLASNQVNAIEFLVSMPSGLIAGTDSGAWQISGGGPGTPVTPASVGAQPQAFVGSSHTMPPLIINYDILYVQLQGYTVRDLSYNFYVNIYTGTDVTLLANHLFYGYQLVEWTWAEAPYKIVHAVRNDGTLLSLTYLKEQEIYGWAHHDTQGSFQSVASIPEGAEQAVYVVVQRTIPGVNSGNPVQYIERFASRNFLTNGVADPTKPWCLDCAAQYIGPPVSTVSGLGYLEGMTVSALADGGVVKGLTVTGGSVTLPNTASVITVGLAYTCQLQTLRIDTGEPTIQSKLKLINRAVARVENTRGLLIGHDFTSLKPYKMRTPNLVYGQPIPLDTGDELMNIGPLWDAQGQVCFQIDDPLPGTVLGVALWMSLGDSPG